MISIIPPYLLSEPHVKKFQSALEDALFPLFGSTHAIQQFCQTAANTRHSVFFNLSRDTTSKQTRISLLKYFGICRILERTIPNFKLDSVWIQSKKKMKSSNFQVECIFVLFNLSVSPVSSSLLSYIADKVSLPIFPDAERLKFFAALVAAEAQGAVAVRAFEEGKSDGLIMKLSSEAAAQFSEILGNKNGVSDDLIDFQVNFHVALANFSAAKHSECETRKTLSGFGMLLARLFISSDRISKCMKMNPTRLIECLSEKVETFLKQIQKDNNLIYHETLPKILCDLPRVIAVRPRSPSEALAALIAEADPFKPEPRLFCPKQVKEAMRRVHAAMERVKKDTERGLTQELWLKIQNFNTSGGLEKAEKMIKACHIQEDECDASLADLASMTMTEEIRLKLIELCKRLNTAKTVNNRLSVKLGNLTEIAPYLAYSRSSLEECILSKPGSCGVNFHDIEFEIEKVIEVGDVDKIEGDESRLMDLMSPSPEVLSARDSFVKHLSESIDEGTALLSKLEQKDVFYAGSSHRARKLRTAILQSVESMRVNRC